MKFESDLQVLRHSDEAVEGARAEEEDGDQLGGHGDGSIVGSI